MPGPLSFHQDSRDIVDAHSSPRARATTLLRTPVAQKLQCYRR